jgi:protein phosphatase
VSEVAENLGDWRGGLPVDGGWALVADGVGGNAAGEIASALAIAILRPMMDSLRSAEDVEKAIKVADTALYLAVEQMPELRGMATTMVGAVMLGEEAIIFNVGDSRAYAFAAGALT